MGGTNAHEARLADCRLRAAVDSVRVYTRSMIVAFAIPPPSHIVCRP
jgi:hypothetical protein